MGMRAFGIMVMMRLDATVAAVMWKWRHSGRAAHTTPTPTTPHQTANDLTETNDIKTKTGVPLIVKSLMGFPAFSEAPSSGSGGGGGAGHGAPAAPNSSIAVVLLVAVPFAAAALFQFINAW